MHDTKHQKSNAAELPFVVGLLADLSGKPGDPLPPVSDRKFLSIDIDNFDDRMRALKPRVAFRVPNRLTGEGNLSIDMTFECIDDFSPAAVAGKVESLRLLLEARQTLANLLHYMEGRSGAEQVISKILQDPALLASIAVSAKTE